MDGVVPASIIPTPTKGKKRLKRHASAPPYHLVVTASPSSTRTIEIGLVLSVFVMALYLFGWFESVRALPDVPNLSFNPAGHFGKNLNLAMDKWTSGNGSGGDDDDDAEVLFQEGEEEGEEEEEEYLEEGEDGEVVTRKKLYKFSNSNQQHKRNKNKRILPNTMDWPDTKWPVSVRDEDGDFETIIHPGDGQTKMPVPKFWSPPVHQGGLMARETAMKIGSCNEPDPKTGRRDRGDDCPVDERTIYFAIASYRDFQCRYTVESAFGRAKNPERIRVGVVDQIVDGEDPACNEPIVPCDEKPEQALCKYKDRIDVYEMEAGLSIGPVFARHIGYRMYRGEYYTTQSDAHVSWSLHWDADIIDQIESTGNEMAVLTTYLTDVQDSMDEQGRSLRNTRPIMCNTYYEGTGDQATHLRHGSQPEQEPTIEGMPQMEPYWAAGFSFSRGHFVVNVPYDWLQPMIFQGEEMSIGIRGFTVGYDMYSPERSVCFHHYAVGNNAKKRNKVPHFWEHARSYAGIGGRAMDRLLGIVHMNPEVDPKSWDHQEEDLYGLGGVRTPEQFYETFGIDVVKKQTEDHLCWFVARGGMHNQFQPLVRPDGMGVDYDQITYKFVDPKKEETE